jgi:hypothetical protein
MNVGVKFEQFLTRLFASENLIVNQAARNPDYDFVLLTPTQRTIIVEAKISRSHQLSVRTLMSAVLMLERARKALDAFKAVIAVPCQIDGLSLEALTKEFPRIVVYDYARLKYLASKHPRLVREFEDIVQQSIYMAEELRDVEPYFVDIGDLLRSTDENLHEPEWDEEDYAAMPKGAELCQRMHSAPEGRGGAKEFESAATNALKFLFDEELTGWAEQKSTEERMSIYDLVARISGKHDFWTMLVQSFRSRYVIFEFKNYSEQIGQSEIYTTEKYLFATALRSTAIIVARNGASKNARRAASGALKEHGKLILVLSADDICEMLELIDGGSDPSDFMLSELDDLLTQLER